MLRFGKTTFLLKFQKLIAAKCDGCRKISNKLYSNGSYMILCTACDKREIRTSKWLRVVKIWKLRSV